jgi:hypothetical protein
LFPVFGGKKSGIRGPPVPVISKNIKELTGCGGKNQKITGG